MRASKKVLSVFVGLFVVALTASLFNLTTLSAPAQAAGEQWQIVDGNTITGKGGLFDKSLFPDLFVKGVTWKFTKFGENDKVTKYHAQVMVGAPDADPCLIWYDLEVNKSDKKGNVVKASYADGDSICEAAIKATGPNGQSIIKQFDKNFTIAAAGENGGGGGGSSEARCELESLGWIICPILTISAKSVTLLGNVLSTLLFLDPLVIPTNTNLNSVAPEQQARVAIFVIWQNIRNVANVLFLLFFMFAIFSIATSMGLSNYSVKRILPRVIVAALLINLSYYLFAWAIDITNVLGKGVQSLLTVSVPSAPEANAQWSDLGLYGVGAAAAVVGVAITGVLAAVLLPFMAAIVIGLFLLMLLVLFREVALTIMVALSPLAAALWILPNTEGFARNFVTTARNLLFIYPFLMGAIAVSNLAAQLILAIGYANS